MSPGGPSSLGTLLVQRLDAALGTTLSVQANVASGARPDAVSQPPTSERIPAIENDPRRDPREAVDHARRENTTGSRSRVSNAELQARVASGSTGHTTTDNTSTPSAPTTLGHAARVILALLARYPGNAPPVQGHTPLLVLGQRGQPQQGGNTAGSGVPVSGALASEGAAAAAQPTTGAHTAQTTTRTTAHASAGRASAPGQAGAGIGDTDAMQAPGGPQAAGSSTAQGTLSAGQGLTRAGQNMTPPGSLPGTGLPSASIQAVTSSTAVQAGEAGMSGAGVGSASAAQAVVHASAGASPLTAQLTSALAQALQESGLFYESHIARMSAGRYPLERLQREPKALARPVSSSGSPQELADLAPEEQLLVRQQLEALANQAIAWQGTAWPDTPLNWEVRREEREDDHGAAVPHWHTRLVIDLPLLGRVEARLALTAERLSAELLAGDATADMMRAGLGELRSGWVRQGLTLDQLSIAGGEVLPATPASSASPAPPGHEE